MINKLRLARWALMAIAGASTVAAVHAGWTLSKINRVNDFIVSPSDVEVVPEHDKAQFAKAFDDAAQGKNEPALERLTSRLATTDEALEAATYFNRANIHMREVEAMRIDDTSRVALIGLAKQDYRNALLVDSSLWQARFNLEYALLMDPEEVGAKGRTSAPKGSEKVVVKAVGFRVDLP